MTEINAEEQGRLWNTLDKIVVRLDAIETQIKEVVRLEEKVAGHSRTLDRFGTRIDEHEKRIREGEIWQAEHNIKNSEKSIKELKEEINNMSHKVDEIEIERNISKGKKDIVKHALGWLVGVLTTALTVAVTFLLTGQV